MCVCSVFEELRGEDPRDSLFLHFKESIWINKSLICRETWTQTFWKTKKLFGFVRKSNFEKKETWDGNEFIFGGWQKKLRLRHKIGNIFWGLVNILSNLSFVESFFLPKPVLDGFDQHFQASVYFPLTRAVNKSQHYQKKFSGMPRLKPGTAGGEEFCKILVSSIQVLSL